MENMEKKEEDVVANETGVIEEKVAGNSLAEKVKKTACKGSECMKEHCKKSGVIFVGVALVLLIAASYGYRVYREKIDIGADAAKAKVQKFVSENVPENVKAEIKDTTKEGLLYKITIQVDKQEVPLFITADGKKLIQAQGVIDLDQAPASAPNKQAQAPEKTVAEIKSDIPVVDLFVMSYCPYGLQMERGALPAIEALGNKIKFNLKFVSYTLHGQKEVDENVNQYCVQKLAPTKLDDYLKCFWKDSKGASTACVKSAGINAVQLASCVADTNKQFNPSEKAFDINKDETVKFGVQGSPTLVINGTTVSSGRDSASVLKAICSGFTTAPKECQAALSATSPAAGFTDQALANGASAASCGN